MHNKLNDDKTLAIPFPGAVPAEDQGKNSLAQMYDESRQVATRMHLPILGNALSPLTRRIEEAGAGELVEAAEEIYLASCARQVIKETARYEDYYTKVVESYRLDSDERLVRLRVERDTAVATLLKTREKMVRIQRLEAMTLRTTSGLEASVPESRQHVGAV